MLYAQSPTEELNQLGRSVTRHSRQVMEQIRSHCKEVDHELVRNLYHEEEDRNALFFVEQGIVHAESGERAIFYFEPGDLIGMHALSQSPPPVIRSMEPVRLLRIDADTLRTQVGASRDWQDYLAAQSAFYAECCCAGISDDASPKPGFRRYSQGETIIQEGDPANEVYELMSGEARVTVQGERVGQVSAGELFGAMAALTRSPRTASVVAEKPCMVMSIPMEQFNELLRTQPRTGLALMENMAQQILSLNEELVELKKGR